jgi:hypothetical protein
MEGGRVMMVKSLLFVPPKKENKRYVLKQQVSGPSTKKLDFTDALPWTVVVNRGKK